MKTPEDEAQGENNMDLGVKIMRAISSPEEFPPCIHEFPPASFFMKIWLDLDSSQSMTGATKIKARF